MGNSDLLCLAYAALWSMGATAVPLDPSEPWESMEEMRHDCKAMGVLTDKDEGASGDDFFRFHLDETVFNNSQITDYESGQASDLALIIYTSGTTGRPKGVMLTQEKLLINAEAVRRLHGMDGEHVHLCILPLFHVNALNFSFLGTLYSGTRLILNRSFHLPDFWRIVAKERPDVVSAVPTILHMLVTDRRNITAKDVPDSLKYFTSAAAPLSKDLAQAFVKRFCVRVNQGYGLSEAVNFSLTVPPDLQDDEYKEIFLNQPFLPAGCPVWANEVAVFAADGHELPDLQMGEVAIRGPHVMLGYLNNESETKATFRNGWLMTGDTGFFKIYKGRRFFFLQGRKKELIIRKGEKISPARLDEILYHPLKSLGVDEYATVGFPNSLSGEEIGLTIALRKETSVGKEYILEVCRDVLGYAHSPKDVIFIKKIQRTSTGKVQRNKFKCHFNHLKNMEYI